MLVRRAETLENLNDLLISSARGDGAVAAISGPTAIGKTALLNAVAERAAGSGSLVLSALGSWDERHVPYGVLGQLFPSLELGRPKARRPAEPCSGARTPDAGDDDTADEGPTAPGTGGPNTDALDTGSKATGGKEASDGDPLTVARAAHEIITRLTQQHHLLITVDDVQHADAASLWCLRYVAQRLSPLSLALVFTHGASIEEKPPSILHDLLYRPNVRRFHLEPLSLDDIAHLAEDEGRTSCGHTSELVTEIHALTAGNPLLVEALLEEHRFCGEPGGAADEPREVGLGAGPGLPTGHVFHQAVLACVHRLGPSAVRLAYSIALLEDSASTLLLSRLSGIDPDLVDRLVRMLTKIGVLDGPRFRRVAVRQAVLHEIPPGDGAGLRHRAARLLHEAGAPARVVAPHLLSASPLREDWVLPVLQEAAHEALVENDVTRVIRYLELANECCTDEAQRTAVKVQYAGVQWQLRPAASAQHFAALKAPLLAGRLPADDTLQLAQGMLFHLDFDDALAVIEHLGTGKHADWESDIELHGTRLLLAAEYPGVLERMRRPLPGVEVSVTSPSGLRAWHALVRILERGADEYAIAMAEQVLQSTEKRPPAMTRGRRLSALLSLIYADRLDAAGDWCERLTAEVGEHDAPAGRAVMDCVSALVALRRGRLAHAVEQATTALAVLSGQKWNVSGAMAVAILVEAHTAMGDHQAAARQLTLEVPPELFLTRAGLHYLYARGRHLLATDNTYMALSDFMKCGELMRRWNIDTPALVPWRLGAAEAWRRLGDHEQATRLVEEQLARADSGLRRSRGMALQSLASVRTAAQRPTILQDALQLLEASGARYETAGVLADLSGAYQKLGDKAKARRTARRAWRIAKSCNAEAMCQALLPTASPQPAGTSTTGGDGAAAGFATFARLSDSERRVAMLAAQAYTNREIADKLFITVSTVEQHLTRVYRKMEIRNREQLLAAIHIDNSQAV
ncbi:ATP-binding protein [Actinomadura chibensis]|uniref:AAA family ATPase n=1 Tax=Actinomadura chibensis TaxID=392828 RepID=A0A5D0NKU3_9ACTN|nr:LuxR family transcriptional regulator [Actinomadura chibensis]TYB44919.1 AAA family ATPase [Actinomadura chibensis]